MNSNNKMNDPAHPDRPDTFSEPTKLPTTDSERKTWQKANKDWWEATPMRYDWHVPISYPEGTLEYYQEIDKRFFDSAEEFLPSKKYPFDTFIPFEKLPEMDVLEIGVGHGSHATLIAPHTKSFTGIDLTEAAAAMTENRLKMAGIEGTVLRMDAEKMTFADQSFDYIWSWGVIHHSADTKAIVSEMHRVLKPGGSAQIMVYHRGWWNYYITAGFIQRIKNILSGQGHKNKDSLHSIAQSATDGAIARYYNKKDLIELCDGKLRVENVVILGQKPDIFPLPAGRYKVFLLRLIPNSLARLMLRKFRMGTFIIATLVK